MIEKLVGYGAEVNCLDNDRRTPLHHAAEANQPKVCKILIEKGAHTNIKDTLKMMTPFDLAPNDNIRQIISGLSVAELKTLAESKRKTIVKVNKKGQRQETTEYDPPGIPDEEKEGVDKSVEIEKPKVPPRQFQSLKKKKTTTTNAKEAAVKNSQGIKMNQQVIIQQVMPPQNEYVYLNAGGNQSLGQS